MFELEDNWGEEVLSGSVRHQMPVSVEGHEVNVSWTLLMEPQQKDKDKTAVRMDTPGSGYILHWVI